MFPTLYIPCHFPFHFPYAFNFWFVNQRGVPNLFPHPLSQHTALTREMASPVSLRLPTSFCNANVDSASQIPTTDQILGTWHIIRTSVPFWIDKRNPSVTFSAPSISKTTSTSTSPSNSSPSHLNNSTTYQALSSSNFKTVKGTDTPIPNQQGIYEWRGTGWLKIASSKWEILGYEKTNDDAWLFVFTPGSILTTGGLILYSNKKEGLAEGALEGIEAALAGWEHPQLRELVGSMFDVKRE